MWVEVANSSLYSDKAIESGLFDCEPDQPAINGVTLPDLTALQVAIFLRTLSIFCQRHLRQEFLITSENLVGRAKGRILIAENLRQNTFRGRDDRMVCEFTRMTLDTLANRILKAALSRCYHYLSQSVSRHKEKLIIWARQCDAALAEVCVVPISDNDFRSLRYPGLMQRYRRPHSLAKMILKRLRTDAQGASNETAETVPFYFNMWRLFELYVGVLLEKTGLIFDEQQSYDFKFTPKGQFYIRPDYVSHESKIVVDAKYKCIIDTSNGEEMAPDLQGLQFADDFSPNNADIYQIIAYSNLLTHKDGKSTPFNKAIIIAPGKPNDSKQQVAKLEDLEKLGVRLELHAPALPKSIIIIPCPVPVREPEAGRR
jgi:5-methylcytosine-specific restriction endonuclease McrBC regulatory subunit McrC